MNTTRRELKVDVAVIGGGINWEQKRKPCSAQTSIRKMFAN
jgi:hypothetical protein